MFTNSEANRAVPPKPQAGGPRGPAGGMPFPWPRRVGGTVPNAEGGLAGCHRSQLLPCGEPFRQRRTSWVSFCQNSESNDELTTDPLGFGVWEAAEMEFLRCDC